MQTKEPPGSARGLLGVRWGRVETVLAGEAEPDARLVVEVVGRADVDRLVDVLGVVLRVEASVAVAPVVVREAGAEEAPMAVPVAAVVHMAVHVATRTVRARRRLRQLG